VLRSKQQTENTIYWDGGATKIAAWKEQHLSDAASTKSPADHDSLCEQNHFCNLLELRTLEVEALVEPPSSPPKSMAKKSTLGFLVHEKDVAPGFERRWQPVKPEN
jgi:hypothetical protein